MACASARAMFLYGGQTLSVACGDIFPWPGEVFPLRWRPWQRGQENPFRHFALRNATSPEGGGLGKEGRSCPRSLTAERIQLLSCKTFRLCQSLSLSGEVARRSRDGEGFFRDEPSQSRCARQLSRRASPWQNRQVLSSFVNGRKNPTVKLQNFPPLPKPLPFGRGGTAKP